MNRITITDEDGQPAGWFDSHAAKSWEEATTHDGRNFISDATGSQWDHEKLFRTAKGAWVLNALSLLATREEDLEKKLELERLAGSFFKKAA